MTNLGKCASRLELSNDTLGKRDGYRQAFAGFDIAQVAAFGMQKCLELCQERAIIRNKAKIVAVVNNAQIFLEIQALFGSFSQYIWNFVNGQPKVNHWHDYQTIPTHTDLWDKITRDLKQRGFKFVGIKLIYAYMQATGLVNDHTVDCFRYPVINNAYALRSNLIPAT